MRTVLRAAAALLVLASVRPSRAAAQGGSGSVLATASVEEPAVVMAQRSLDFGTVFPGVASTVDPAAPTAGYFVVRFHPNSTVNLAFTLPAALQGPGGATLPVGAWSGLWNRMNSPTGATAFTPSATATTVSVNGSRVHVYVGATVWPAGTQPAGTYTADVTLTGSYVGL